MTGYTEISHTIREQASALGIPVAILVDLQGPSIRTGEVNGKLSLKKGAIVEFRNVDLAASKPLSVTTNYDGLHNDVSVGDVMLVDNGEIHFRVLQIETGRLTCEVLTEGEMGSRRHIDPGIRVNLPPLTEKDMRDIDLAAELDVDYIAISFVRDAEHVVFLRSQLEARDCKALIVSKIEDQEAVKHLTDIITQSDAIMVARGDLGIEVHIEELPVIQRNILRECARIGRKVIVATHMLESMIENPVPTRAEVSDVANAVFFEQTDAVMLSGETSIGRYPVKCVEMLDRIAKRIEREPGAGFFKEIELTTEKQFTVKSAVVLANSLENSCLIIFTARGILANFAAQQRPEHAEIFAFSPDDRVVVSLRIEPQRHTVSDGNGRSSRGKHPPGGRSVKSARFDRVGQSHRDLERYLESRVRY